MSTPNQIDDFFTAKSKREKQSASQKTKKQGLGWLRQSWPSRAQLHQLPRVLNKTERRIALGLIFIFAIAVIYIPISLYANGTTAAPDFGGSYSEGIIGEPRFINPLLAQANDADRDLTTIIFSGLLKYNPQGELVPDLADNFKISGDGLTYTFTLKPAQWHDGQALTAGDVVFTIQTAQNPDYNSSQQINWQGVKASAPDDRTVIFTLKNIYAQFLNNLTLGIIPKHLWGDVPANAFSLSELNLQPIGSGPYVFEKLKKDNQGRVKSLKLKSFENYYEGRPFIDNLEFVFFASEDAMLQGYKQGGVDGLSLISSKNLKNFSLSNRLNVQSVQIPRYFGIFLNQNNNPVLDDKNIRLALNYATDREALVTEVLNGSGTVVHSPVLPDILHIGEVTTKYKFDLEFANQILDNGNWPRDERGIRTRNNRELNLSITTSDWPELVAVAQIIEQQWEKIGASIDIIVLPIGEIQQRIRRRDYESLLFGEILSPNPDPFSFWHSSQKTDPGLNLALYDNNSADNLLEDARQTINPIERAQKYDDFQKILLEDAPAIFLYSPDYLYAPSKKVKGLEIRLVSIPSDRFDSINTWYVKTKRVSKEG